MTKSSKLFKNMNVDSTPESTVKPSAVQESRPKRGAYNKEKTFKDTNLKISTHERNSLVALTLMGKALNQKGAINFLLNEYYKSMSDDSKQQFDTFVKALDSKDSKFNNK